MPSKKPKNITTDDTVDPAKIKLFIDPGDASVETIKDVLLALNNLFVASGGDGLIFEEKEQFELHAAGAVA